MTAKVLELYEQSKTFTPEERNQLLELFFDDPQIREDILDIALMIQAESESTDYVTLDEFKAGTQVAHAL